MYERKKENNLEIKDFCNYCGEEVHGGRCRECGGTLERYPPKAEEMEKMPFQHEGVLWVFCVLCNQEVKVADSKYIGKNHTYRVCKTHPPEVYQHVLRELEEYGN